MEQCNMWCVNDRSLLSFTFPQSVSYRIINNALAVLLSLICYNTVTCRWDDTHSDKYSCIRWAQVFILPSIMSTAVAMSGCLTKMKLKVGICDISPLHFSALQHFSTQELLESICLQVLTCFFYYYVSVLKFFRYERYP